MTTDKVVAIRFVAVLHGLSLIAAVAIDLVFRNAAVEAAEAQFLREMVWLPGGLLTMGIVSATYVALTFLNVVLIWREVTWTRWTMMTWWVMSVVLALLNGPAASSAASLIAEASLFATAGIMLWYTFTRYSA